MMRTRLFTIGGILLIGLVSILPAQVLSDLTPRTFQFSSNTLPYRLLVPQGYTNQTKFPLVLFFHGAVGRGNDNQKQITDQPIALNFIRTDNQERWPSFFVAPQCPAGQTWANMTWEGSSGTGQFSSTPSWPMAAVMALIDSLIKEFPAIDTTRLIVTGLSMGGFGTWDIICRQPLKFSLAIPICGGGDPQKVSTVPALAQQRIFAYHAEDDGIVGVNRTREMVNAVKNLTGYQNTLRYTEYPASRNLGHFSWFAAYSDTTLWSDLFGPRLFGPQGGDGLVGHYFSTKDWSGTALVRTCPVINNSWEDRVPFYSELPRDNFSIRYSGFILAPTTETYTFFIRADDRASLWIDNQQLIATASNGSAPIALQAGRRYPITIDYFDAADEATLILSWQSASISKQVVPGDYLFSNADPTATSLPRTTHSFVKPHASLVTTLSPTMPLPSATYYRLDGKRMTTMHGRQLRPFSIVVQEKSIP
jgi:predicted esterase